MLKHVLQRRAHPGDDGEEGEGHNSPGSITYASKVWRGMRPLVGQDTEADEPQERPHRCPAVKVSKQRNKSGLRSNMMTAFTSTRLHFLFWGMVPLF